MPNPVFSAKANPSAKVAPAKKPTPQIKVMPVSTKSMRDKGFSTIGPQQKKFNAAQLGRAGTRK